MTLEALDLLRRSHLDGVKIDVKGDQNTYQKFCGSLDANVPWRNAEAARNMGIHVEIVNLVISGVNDDDSTLVSVIDKHLKHLGPETPIHFTRYFPAYKFHAPPTDVGRLEHARETARKAGVKYAYIGNVRGHTYENTFCPECGERLIARSGYEIVSYKVTKEKRCPKCTARIPITGMYIQKRREPTWVSI
jgi:pyruvate formate lyase activating enzyme